MTRFAVFSNNQLLRTGLCHLLSAWSAGEVVLDSGLESSAADLLVEARPDAAIVDLGPQPDLSLVREIKDSLPAGRVLLLGFRIAPDVVSYIARSRIGGLISVTSPPELFREYLRQVMEDQCPIDPALVPEEADAQPVLTAEERELIVLLTEGLSNVEIAAQVGVSDRAIRSRVVRLCAKVRAKDRFELTLFGLKNFGGEESISAAAKGGAGSESV